MANLNDNIPFFAVYNNSTTHCAHLYHFPPHTKCHHPFVFVLILIRELVMVVSKFHFLDLAGSKQVSDSPFPIYNVNLT